MDRASKVSTDAVLITCEHGGNRVPGAFARLFRGREALLRSHRGWDPGALDLARVLASRLCVPLIASTVTRLLVDLNRSPGHPGLLSVVTRACGTAERDRILARHYLPYRTRVQERVAAELALGRRVLHLSIHSFVPRLGGETRRADLGLLYDPGRTPERRFCARLKGLVQTRLPEVIVRRNYPYRGAADGLTTWLRRRNAGSRYLGVEIEINQKLVAGSRKDWRRFRDRVSAVLAAAVER